MLSKSIKTSLRQPTFLTKIDSLRDIQDQLETQSLYDLIHIVIQVLEVSFLILVYISQSKSLNQVVDPPRTAPAEEPQRDLKSSHQPGTLNATRIIFKRIYPRK